MFGISKREILANAVKNACVNKLPIYEDDIRTLVRKYGLDDDSCNAEVENEFLEARINYMNEVCDSITDSLSISSPNFFTRFKIALMQPQITGLPTEFNTQYFCDNGISAGIVFALAYYSLTNKTVDDPKLIRTISMVSHYQHDLMTDVLHKINDEFL